MYVFKTFVFLFDEATPVLPVRQFFDLTKLCDWNGILNETLNHLVQKCILNYSALEALSMNQSFYILNK